MGNVVVVGGVNQDVTVAVDRRPHGGETVVGEGPSLSPGGKGANQAAAVAFAGSTARLCAVVGDDGAGSAQVAELRDAGVDVSCVRVAEGFATGSALILLTPDGENSIVVGSGANALLDGDDVRAALDGAVDVVLVQTEPGVRAAEAAATEARRRGLLLVANAAPATGLSAAMLRACDPLIVNEHEARDLLGERGDARDVALTSGELAIRLHAVLGCRSVVVSLGSQGATVVHGDATTHVPAPRVVARDTTGAGDVLVGVIAAWLSQGVDVVEATRQACEAAARAVTTLGARGYLSPT